MFASETLNPLSDILLATAFVTVATTLLFAIARQERLNPSLKLASMLYGCGLIAVAFSILTPHFWPALNRTGYEFLIKLIAAVILVSASFVGWPLVRLAIRHTRLLGSLPDTELLLMERDDLAAANSELEKEIVRRSYQLERVNRQMRLAIMGSPITLFRQDRDRQYTWIFNPPAPIPSTDLIGKSEVDVFPRDAAIALADIKERAMETHEEQSGEIRVRFPSGVFWYLLRTQPDYDEQGEVIGTLSCAIDITEQKRQQQRQHLLMREVTHRSKNLLAVLQGIVRQTAHRSKTLDEFSASFTARLHSIARSHDLLVHDDWSGTSLNKLIESQLTVLSDIEPGRIDVKGPDVLLTAVAVQNLGMAFHELATNAMKYGSLSAPGGKVEIAWQLMAASENTETGEEQDGRLTLTWREVGGPHVEVSEESGFGRMLLERVVGRALGGTAELSFLPEGLVCTMVLPAARVIASEEE